jgi:predicted CDP-diglyceride synthetase/phosphatidate cytidylyltransferase
VIANLLLFLRFPIEVSYLIPAAFFLLLLLGTNLLARSRAVAWAFLVAVFSLNFVTPQLVTPDTPGRATGARLHFALAPGTMIDDVRLRRALRGCGDYNCYYRHFHPGSHAAEPLWPMQPGP